MVDGVEVVTSQGSPLHGGGSVQGGGSIHGSLGLGKDEFLRLLVTEMRYQTPLDPADQKEFIAQMAQFASLEQMQNLNSNLTTLAEMQLIAQASALIGRVVEATTKEGVIKGTVSQVELLAGVPFLVVSGKKVHLSEITKVS